MKSWQDWEHSKYHYSTCIHSLLSHQRCANQNVGNVFVVCCWSKIGCRKQSNKHQTPTTAIHANNIKTLGMPARSNRASTYLIVSHSKHACSTKPATHSIHRQRNGPRETAERCLTETISLARFHRHDRRFGMRNETMYPCSLLSFVAFLLFYILPRSICSARHQSSEHSSYQNNVQLTFGSGTGLVLYSYWIANPTRHHSLFT